MKFVIFLGLALCLLAAVHAEDEKVPEKDKSAVEKIIQATLDKIQNLFDATIIKVQSLVDSLFETINKSIEAGINALGDILNEIEKVAAKGEKYERCYLEQKPALKVIADKYAAQTAQCQDVATDKTKAIINDLIGQATDTQKEVGQVAAKCFEEHPYTALICATRDAAAVYFKATVNIGKSMFEAQGTLAQISVEGAQCIKAAFEESNAANEKILKAIETCATA